jgi:Ras-related protein Rab-7A
LLSASAMSTSTSIAPTVAPTITPARYANTLHYLTTQTKPPCPPRGPKLFFTSAKTGSGVSEVFAYVARRVVVRWEWEEANASEFSLVGDCSTVHLDDAMTGKKGRFGLRAVPHEVGRKTAMLSLSKVPMLILASPLPFV